MIKYFIQIVLVSVFFAQVNTEVYRKTKIDSGFQYQSDFNLTYKSGNSDYSSYKIFSRINYYTDFVKNFLVYSLKKGSAGNKSYQNQSFFHYRSIISLSKTQEIEIFTQFEYNDFINLNNRSLYGSYFRYAFLAPESENKLFVASGIMKELESYGNLNNSFDIWRSTNYLTLTYKISDHLKFISVTYYQFDISNTNDYRILNNSTLNSEISENIIFKSEFDYRYDSLPFSKISPEDIEISFGLSFFF